MNKLIKISVLSREVPGEWFIMAERESDGRGWRVFFLDYFLTDKKL